jgi:hypothetical protein
MLCAPFGSCRTPVGRVALCALSGCSCNSNNNSILPGWLLAYDVLLQSAACTWVCSPLPLRILPCQPVDDQCNTTQADSMLLLALQARLPPLTALPQHLQLAQTRCCNSSTSHPQEGPAAVPWPYCGAFLWQCLHAMAGPCVWDCCSTCCVRGRCCRCLLEAVLRRPRTSPGDESCHHRCLVAPNKAHDQCFVHG